MGLGRGRGHPRKTLQPPLYDDYLVDAPKDLQERWLQKKATEQWRYNKLMSDSASEYHRSENECASHYYHERKKKTVAAAAGTAPSQPKDDPFCEEEEETARQQREDTSKEKIHQR